MSDTTTVSSTSGWTLYDVFLQGTNIYNGTTSLVAISGATWTACAIARSEIGTTGIYGPPTITNLPAGTYTREVRRQIGGSAAQTDPVLYVDTAFDPAVSGTTTPAAAIAAALSATANLTIYAPATGSTIDLFRGDDFSAAPMTITKSSSETHWPTTLSTVHAWVRPKANLIALDSDASGMPALVTATSLVSSSTTATLTLPSGHGLVSGIMAISGATPDVYNGYFNVTVSGNTATYTFAGSTTATASGTIKVQPGIACTVTSATGSSQAFTFGPTMQQTVLLSAAASNGYDFHFVANVASVPRMLRSGTLNSRRSPAGA